MEEEIDAEISAAKKTPSKNTEVTPQKVKTKYSNRPEVDLRSLDEMVYNQEYSLVFVFKGIHEF